MEEKEEYPTAQVSNTRATSYEMSEQEMMKLPRAFSLAHLMDMDYLGPISQIFSDGSDNSTFDIQNNTSNSEIDPFVKPQMVEMPDQYAEDPGNFQMMKQSSNINNQPMFVNLRGYDQ